MISDGAITGTLKYVSGGWDSGTWGADESTGNYLALHCASDMDDVTITVEVVGGTHGPATLDEDGLIICRIASTSQKIKVVATKTGHPTTTKEYALTGLTLSGEA